jgi:type II secretory pathway component GspD/PulD (secretin)
MTVDEVSLLIDFLVRNGRSKLISNPRVTTVSNRKAEIEVTTTIPVETLNRFSEAGVVQDIISFQDLDVSINLAVKPRVNADSTISLDVSSVVEEITGFTGPADNQRPITSKRAVSSSVTIRHGESLGLGGLMKEVKHETVKKLPILGSIPLIGRVFQHRKTTIEKTDLLILSTPRIISAS